MHTNQSIKKGKTGTALALVTVLVACYLSVGIAPAASGDSYLENMPRPSGAPNFDFNRGNFTFPDGFNPFNGTGGPGGPGGFMGGNGTFPDGMNGNFTRPDASGGPGYVQPFNGQNQATTQTDNTLLIAGIAVAAVIIIVIVVVVLKKRKKNPDEASTYQAAPPSSSTGASASP